MKETKPLYKTVPLICLATLAAVAMPGDSPLVWTAGAAFALAGPLMHIAARKRAVIAARK